VLRRIFEPKREEMVRDWRRLHNEELHEVLRFIKYSGDKINSMRWAGHKACMRETRNAHSILFGELKG
jgi:hypothetical protein